MIVKKQTEINLGRGTPEDIVRAIEDAGLPEKAVLVKVTTEFEDLLNSEKIFNFVSYVTGTFEWSDEE